MTHGNRLHLTLANNISQTQIQTIQRIDACVCMRLSFSHCELTVPDDSIAAVAIVIGTINCTRLEFPLSWF